MINTIINSLRRGWSLLLSSKRTDNVKTLSLITMEPAKSSSALKPTSERNLQFLELIGQLKHLKRKGWVIRDVQNPETVASHMYRMAVMSFLIEPSSNIDRIKCMELAIVHDMAECIVGDITPICGISQEEKHRREEEAMERLADLIPTNSAYIHELFKEYEKQESVEAKLVKEFDRLDMVIQAFEYEKSEGTMSSRRLEEFFSSTEGKFSTPFVLSIVEELKRQRDSSANSEQ